MLLFIYVKSSLLYKVLISSQVEEEAVFFVQEGIFFEV